MTFLSWPPSPKLFQRFQTHSIDNLKSEMAYALSDELQSAQSSKFQPLFLSMFYTRTFPSLDFDPRIELNMLRICNSCDGIGGVQG